MRPRIALLALAVLAGAPVAAVARDCPELGLPRAEADRFCEDFRRLLYAPFDPDTDRDFAPDRAQQVQRLIQSDPLWGEVYRSDPKQTLELIKRIRDAGGLPTN